MGNMYTCGICYIDFDVANPEHKDFKMKIYEGYGHMYWGLCSTEYYMLLIED